MSAWHESGRGHHWRSGRCSGGWARRCTTSRPRHPSWGCLRQRPGESSRSWPAPGYLLREPSTGRAVRWRRTTAGEAVATASVRATLLAGAGATACWRASSPGWRRSIGSPISCAGSTAVGVFGSYLTETPSVARTRRRRPASPRSRRRRARRTPSSARTATCRTGGCRICSRPREWPRWRERHVELFLAAGLRGLVLHRFDDPILHGHRVRLVFLDQPDLP